MGILMNYRCKCRANEIIAGGRETALSMYQSQHECGADTPSHVNKTGQLMGIMVDAINAKMPGRYSEKDKEMLIKAAEYHDIGKITVPVSVLDKNGRPTPEEFSVIQMHPVNGSDIILSWLGNSDLSKEDADVIKLASEMALSHHEKVDGTGYPYGLKGEDIPESARMMAVVDVLEALTAQRAYKPSMSFERAESIIREGAGTQFDANLVDILFSNSKARDEMNKIINEGRVEKMNEYIGEDR